MGLKYGFRSGLEEKTAAFLTARGVPFTFEAEKITYQKPATNHTYCPDFRLPNGIYIETKGRFLVADRMKHILIKAQHPDRDIRFVFSNSKAKISKGSKTSYADWAAKNGFKFADKEIPDAWLREEPK